MAIDPQTLTLPLVIIAGLVDGFNPCAFAVLLLFITFTMGMLQLQANYRYGLMKDYFIPDGFGLAIPRSLHAPLNNWIRRTSAPGVFGAGVLVGLCTIPCSGGIYLAVLGLLTLQSTLTKGILYLMLYNMMLISPLVAVLLASSNRFVVDKIVAWQSRNKTWVKLLMGSFMVAMGFAILLII